MEDASWKQQSLAPALGSPRSGGRDNGSVRCRRSPGLGLGQGSHVQEPAGDPGSDGGGGGGACDGLENESFS